LKNYFQKNRKRLLAENKDTHYKLSTHQKKLIFSSQLSNSDINLDEQKKYIQFENPENKKKIKVLDEYFKFLLQSNETSLQKKGQFCQIDLNENNFEKTFLAFFMNKFYQSSQKEDISQNKPENLFSPSFSQNISHSTISNLSPEKEDIHLFNFDSSQSEFSQCYRYQDYFDAKEICPSLFN
jgi:hypothetical protein